MWSSTGLGPPTYRPFEFPYDEYRGGMGEFGPLGGSPVTTWGPTPPTQSTITTTQEERSEDSVRFKGISYLIQRNWILDTDSDFVIPLSLQPDVVDL